MELILVGRCMFWPNLACKFVTMCDKVMINVIQIVVDMKYFKLKKSFNQHKNTICTSFVLSALLANCVTICEKVIKTII